MWYEGVVFPYKMAYKYLRFCYKYDKITTKVDSDIEQGKKTVKKTLRRIKYTFILTSLAGFGYYGNKYYQ